MKFRVSLSLIGCLLFLPSCLKKTSISDADEVFWLNVMEDVYVAKAASQRYFGLEKDSMHSYHYSEVLEKYSLDSIAIDSFMDMMVKESLMEGFYDKLMQSIESREDSLSVLMEEIKTEE